MRRKIRRMITGLYNGSLVMSRLIIIPVGTKWDKSCIT